MAERREHHIPLKPGDLKCGPPENPESLEQRDLFLSLLESGSWTHPALTDLIEEKLEDKEFCARQGIARWQTPDVKHDRIKNWTMRDMPPEKDIILAAFMDVLLTKGGRFGPDWQAAFIKHWVARRLEARDNRKNDAPTNKRIKALQDFCCKDPVLTRLPSLFETDQTLPVASAYVDLAVSSSVPARPAADRMQAALSLSERISQRIARRSASKRSPREIFDVSAMETGLILGDPGAGKSSLLKRISLGIASGEWSNSRVPLFVEARDYWQARRMGSQQGLLDFALARFEGLDKDPRGLLLKRHGKDRPAAILLVDGLDEIANSQDAVRLIYSELRSLAARLPWIATCRPTGLVGALAENLRCTVCDLDEEAIEKLVNSWCKAVSGESFAISGKTLLPEIFGSSANREMARNPFLLTALCYLKTQAPDESLPSARIDVYSRLIERIGEQARLKAADPGILDETASRALEGFCYHLYKKLDARQIFTLSDWNAYTGTLPEPKVDLARSVLPSRLLTAWDVGEPRFHFLHLTLQEFLVAKALAEKPPAIAVAVRFSPAWRQVFRLYTALLQATGEEKSFRELVQILFRDQDFSSYGYVTLAEIFADAGIPDTTPWVGEDLRPRLHGAAMSGDDLAPEVLYDALALLDANWLTDRTLEQIASRMKFKDDGEVLLHGVMVGPTLDSPYEILARARTPLACQTILDTFWGEDHTEALSAAFAFASIATPKQRKAVVDHVLQATGHDDFAARFIPFAEAGRRVEFLPALERILGWTREEGGADYGQCLSVVANIGGPEAARLLGEMLQYEADRMDGPFNAFEQVQDCVLQMGGAAARILLEGITEHPALEHWREALQVTALGTGAADLDTVDAFLNNPVTRDEAISALSDAATRGVAISDETYARMVAVMRGSDRIDMSDIVLLESARLQDGRPPMLCDLLLNHARDLLRRLQDPEDVNSRDHLLGEFQFALDPLGRAPWTPARDFVREVLFDPNVDDDILFSVIHLAGRVFADSADREILDRLIALWFQETDEMWQEIALAVGRIDLDTLFYYQSASGAFHALELIAAEHDLLIFDDFYADRQGEIIAWRTPPQRMFFLFEPNAYDMMDLMAHALAEHGVALVPRNSKLCEGVVIFGDLPEDEHKLLEEFRHSHNKQPAVYQAHLPEFEVPDGLSEQEIPPLAQQIAEKLHAIRRKKRLL